MSTDDLLEQMVSVLFFNGAWYARAKGRYEFCQGQTAREAMLAALDMSEPSVAQPNSDLF